jgi:beta-RFAP synthase
MIRVTAAARLHFGLLSMPADGEAFWPDRHGRPTLPVRHFGGAGLMIEDPALRLRVEPAADWSAEGPLAERALAFARRYAPTLPPGSLAPQHLVVEGAPTAHCGFGTGTQLGLAVARALSVAAGRPDLSAAELAPVVGRGLRSAVGIHGFQQGGFLVEGGKRAGDALAPLVARVPFPDAWRVVVAVPPTEPGLHDELERDAFRRLLARPGTADATGALCRAAVLGMVPALLESDLAAFGEALHDFNARAGELFFNVQCGVYASRTVGDLVAFLRHNGVRGVGQSSWGPAVFAVTGDPGSAAYLLGRLRNHCGLAEGQVVVTNGCNRGAKVSGSE